MHSVWEFLCGMSGYVCGPLIGAWLFPRERDITVQVTVSEGMDGKQISHAVRESFERARGEL